LRAKGVRLGLRITIGDGIGGLGCDKVFAPKGGNLRRPSQVESQNGRHSGGVI